MLTADQRDLVEYLVSLQQLDDATLAGDVAEWSDERLTQYLDQHCGFVLRGDQWMERCPGCNGSGQRNQTPCPYCSGTGYTLALNPLSEDST